MAFKVLFGGRCRPSFSTPSSTYTDSETWEQGEVLTVDATTGYLKPAGHISVPMGLACEYRRSADADETAGDNIGSIIVDAAVVETDRVASGITFVAGNTLYVNDGGDLQNTDPGSGTKVGVVLKVATDGTVTWLFSPQY